MSKKARIPFEAYRGKEPYIFVSYAHKESAQVYPQILDLHNAGYHIWYDEGIEPGRDWTEEIGRALQNAAFFITFISPNSVESKNVRNEINFALEKKTPFLAIYLEETQLPAGLMLQIGSIQAIMKYNLAEEKYFAKLTRVLKSRFENVSAVRPAPPSIFGFLSNKLFLLTTILLIAGSATIIKVFPDLIPTGGKSDTETQKEPPEKPPSTKGNDPSEDNSNTAVNPIEKIAEKIEKPAAGRSEAKIRTSLLSEIDIAEKEMNTARENVPGSKMDKDEDDNYQQANIKRDSANSFENSNNLNDLENQLRLLNEAINLYGIANSSISVKLAKADADFAKARMKSAKGEIDQMSYEESKYKEAIGLEKQGDTEYDILKNFAVAATHYQNAQILFLEVQSDENKKREELRRAIAFIIKKYTTSIKRGDIEAFRKLFYQPTKAYLKGWTSFLKKAKGKKVVAHDSNERYGKDKVTFDVEVSIGYADNKNRPDRPDFTDTWTIQKIAAEWMITGYGGK